MKNVDYVGSEINGIKIIKYFCVPYENNGIKRSRPHFQCLCICGKEFSARSENIKNGIVKSCGCLTSELMAHSHMLPDNLGAINKLFANYKATAIRKLLTFNISIDEFKLIINKNCFYCGIEPQSHKFLGSNNKYKYLKYNGIDRIDNNVGYNIDNCVSCCSFCNSAKSNHSLDEFNDWIKRLVKFYVK